MPSCAVATCLNNHRTKVSMVTGKVPQFHGFPQEERCGGEVVRKWLEACGKRKNPVNLKRARVCSDHFVEGDYKRNLQAELLGLPFTPRLKEEAVPHLHLEGGGVVEASKKGGGRTKKKGDVGIPVVKVKEESSSSLPSVPPTPPESFVENSDYDGASLSSSAVVIPDRTNCLICYANIASTTTSRCSNGGEEGGDNTSILFKHLSVIFLFRKVLELPLSQVEKYLSCCSDPEKWTGFCDKCSDIVANCMELHNKLLKITSDFNGAKKELIEMIKVSVVKKRTMRSRFPSIADQSRRFVHDRNYDYGQLSNPFEDGDRMARELVNSSKKTVIILLPEENGGKAKSAKKTFKDSSIIKKHGARGDPSKTTAASTPPSSFANLFHKLKSGPGATSISVIPSKAGTRPMPQSDKKGEVTVKEEPLDDEEHFADFNDDNISCDLTGEDPLKLEVEAMEEDPAEDDDDVQMIENDDYEWRMDEDLDVEETGEEEDGETKEMTCPLCGEFKFKVKRGELLCEHLEICAGKPGGDGTSPEEDPSFSLPATLICPTCNKYTAAVADKINFAEHIGICLGPSVSAGPPPLTSRIFQCSLCPRKKFMKLNRFIIHYLHHKKMIRIDCSKCPKKFQSLKGFRAHWYRKHPSFVPTAQRRRLRYKKVTCLPQIPWWCPHCPQPEKFSAEQLRDDHILSCHSNDLPPPPPHACPTPKCSKAYHSEDELHLHTTTVHLPPNRFHYCDICLQVFQNLKPLHLHKRRLHNRGLYNCTICGTSYARRKSLDVHLRLHSDPSKITGMTCATCNKVFSTNHALRIHVDAVHRKIVKFCCQICARPFYDTTGFKRHMARVHKMGTFNVKFYPCPVEDCGHKARGKVKLEHHFSWHRKDPQFKCSFCGKDFYFPEKLKRHEYGHGFTNPEDMPYQCEVCGRKFVRRDLMRMHIRIHDPTFRSKVAVRTGKRKVARRKVPTAGANEEGNWKCSTCGECCGGPRLLSRHIRAQHPDNLRTCEICGNVFATELGRYQHVKFIHEKWEGKACEICGKVLRSNNHLKRHHQQVHSK